MRVDRGARGVGTPRRDPPYQDTWLWLLEPPPFGLLASMVVAAEWGETAFAGDPALVPGDGVVQVAAGRGPGAAGRGAGGVPGPDQVGQGAAGVVAGLGSGVAAGAAGDREQRAGEPGQGARGPGAGRGAPAGRQAWAAAVPSGFTAVTHHRVRGCLAARSPRPQAAAGSRLAPRRLARDRGTGPGACTTVRSKKSWKHPVRTV